MQAGSSDTFEELFTYACPKFVSAAPPDFANPGANSNMEAFRVQLRWGSWPGSARPQADPNPACIQYQRPRCPHHILPPSTCRAFMSVVEERKHLPALKQFLKLYSVSASVAAMLTM